MSGNPCTREICHRIGCRGYRNCSQVLEKRERVHEAVQGELKLLATELGVEGYGARFSAIVDQITNAVTKALETGNWDRVQRIIDKNKKIS